MKKVIVSLLLAATIAACVGAPPTPSPSPAPSPTLNPSLFFLRAWYTQALPPQHTFNWLSALTIADGTVIDGNVAVPAIYPGPLMIVPNSRSISDVGIAAVLDEARRLGLLGGVTDFTGDAGIPGARLGQIEMFVNGANHYELVGNPDTVVRCGSGSCDVAPGTPEAFAAFWQQLSTLDALLGAELGATGQYVPERLAVLLTAPARPEPGLEQQLATWPLEETFHEIGVDFPGLDGARCVTLSGDDLEMVLPVLQHANQLTVFHDTVDTTKSAIAVVVVPGADSPCPDES